MNGLRMTSDLVGLLFSADHAAWIARIPGSLAFHNPERMASAFLCAHALYDHGLVVIHSDAFIGVEALGGSCRFPEAGPPILVQRPRALPRRSLDPQRDGRIPLLLDAAAIVRRHLASRAVVAVSVTGPFTLAAGLEGEARFLESVGTPTSRNRDALACAQESTVNLVRAARREGLIVMLAEPLAAAVSPALFEAVAAPALRHVLAEGDAIVHICGDCAHLLRLLPALGAPVVSLDDVDLTSASRVLPQETVLLAGLSPATIREGPPERVRIAAREAGARAAANVRPCSGCDLVWDTPPSHAQAFVRGARDAIAQRERSG